MGYPAKAHIVLELPGDELWPIVRDDARGDTGKGFTGALQDRLHVGFRHRLTNLPVHDIAAVAVQAGTQVVERATDIQVRDVDVPVFVWLAGLGEPLALG